MDEIKNIRLLPTGDFLKIQRTRDTWMLNDQWVQYVHVGRVTKLSLEVVLNNLRLMDLWSHNFIGKYPLTMLVLDHDFFRWDPSLTPAQVLKEEKFGLTWNFLYSNKVGENLRVVLLKSMEVVCKYNG